MTHMTLDQALKHGVQLHQAGRLAEAERIYRQILSAAANHPDALHFLGLIAFDQQRVDEAIELLGRAIAINPQSSGYRCNLGRILTESGQTDAAVTTLREALQLEPRNPDAWNNLGTALLKQDQFDGSIDAFGQAIRLRPQFVEARNNLGQALLTQGRLEQATALFHEAITLNPKYPAAHANLGIALKRQGHLPQAVEAFRAALSLEPHSEMAQVNYGKILHATGEFDQAIILFRNVIASHGQNADAHCGLGEALLAKGQKDQAVDALKSAMALEPPPPDLLNNLGNAFHAAGEFEQAEACYRKAIQFKPNWALAKYNLGVLRLLLGDFAQGWPLYESRLSAPDLDQNFSSFPQPRWDGSDLNGRRILLHAEQALGDSIQFIRYAPQVAQHGGKIILQVQPDLVDLFRQVPNIEQVLAMGEPAPSFDVHCPLMSLPSLLGMTSDLIPYLKANPEQSQRWHDRLVDEKRFKVGIVWAGRSTHPNDRNRSMTLETLSPLNDISNVALFSLQKGTAAEQLSKSSLNIVDWTSDLQNFTDSAALIDHFDLILSVDTSIAHLAGAMGKPVWLMLPFIPDWRWMLHRSDSPWYPTARLFRQTDPGDWNPVIKGIVEALQELRPQPT